MSDTIERWATAEQRRDQLQAQLDRLDAMENAGLRTEQGERERLDAAISAADTEIEDAEIADLRAMGDHGEADRLETERELRDAALRVEVEDMFGLGDEN